MELLNYWGKAKDSDEGPNWHPLVYHSLDVASVGDVYLNKHQEFLRFISNEINVTPSTAQNWIRYLLLIHDLGKFSRAFQGQKPDLIKEITGASPPPTSYEIRHDTLGFMAWSNWGMGEDFMFNLPEGLKERKWSQHWSYWVRASCGHHGMPPEENLTDQLSMALHFSGEDEINIKRYLNEIKNLFEPEEGFVPKDDFLKKSKKLSWWLAGLTILSDWVGSNRTYFPYQAPQFEIEEYWKLSLKKAEEAIKGIGILPSKPGLRRNFEDLFSLAKNAKPRPLQKFCQELEIENKPQLFILEDLTGSGKTESAILLANQLLSKNAVNGIYFALPTMATANAIYSRLGESYRKLFSADSNPSIVLAHSGRNFSDAFKKSLFQPGPGETDYSKKMKAGLLVVTLGFLIIRKNHS